jgi:hypothetical protein
MTVQETGAETKIKVSRKNQIRRVCAGWGAKRLMARAGELLCNLRCVLVLLCRSRTHPTPVVSAKSYETPLIIPDQGQGDTFR